MTWIGHWRNIRCYRGDNLMFPRNIHFHDCQVELWRHGLQASKQGRSNFREALFRVARPSYEQRCHPFSAQHCVQQ